MKIALVRDVVDPDPVREEKETDQEESEEAVAESKKKARNGDKSKKNADGGRKGFRKNKNTQQVEGRKVKSIEPRGMS
jgi:hypothetical protein